MSVGAIIAIVVGGLAFVGTATVIHMAMGNLTEADLRDFALAAGAQEPGPPTDPLLEEFQRLEAEVRRRDCPHRWVEVTEFGNATICYKCVRCGMDRDTNLMAPQWRA